MHGHGNENSLFAVNSDNLRKIIGRTQNLNRDPDRNIMITFNFNKTSRRCVKQRKALDTLQADIIINHNFKKHERTQQSCPRHFTSGQN